MKRLLFILILTAIGSLPMKSQIWVNINWNNYYCNTCMYMISALNLDNYQADAYTQIIHGYGSRIQSAALRTYRYWDNSAREIYNLRMDRDRQLQEILSPDQYYLYLDLVREDPTRVHDSFGWYDNPGFAGYAPSVICYQYEDAYWHYRWNYRNNRWFGNYDSFYARPGSYNGRRPVQAPWRDDIYGNSGLRNDYSSNGRPGYNNGMGGNNNRPGYNNGMGSSSSRPGMNNGNRNSYNNGRSYGGSNNNTPRNNNNNSYTPRGNSSNNGSVNSYTPRGNSSNSNNRSNYTPGNSGSRNNYSSGSSNSFGRGYAPGSSSNNSNNRSTYTPRNSGQSSSSGNRSFSSGNSSRSNVQSSPDRSSRVRSVSPDRSSTVGTRSGSSERPSVNRSSSSRPSQSSSVSHSRMNADRGR